MATTGLDLRLERVRAHLTVTEVAAHMGLSRQTLWATERAARVEPERADAYLRTVRALRDAKEASAA